LQLLLAVIIIYCYPLLRYDLNKGPIEFDLSLERALGLRLSVRDLHQTPLLSIGRLANLNLKEIDILAALQVACHVFLAHQIVLIIRFNHGGGL